MGELVKGPLLLLRHFPTQLPCYRTQHSDLLSGVGTRRPRSVRGKETDKQSTPICFSTCSIKAGSMDWAVIGCTEKSVFYFWLLVLFLKNYWVATGCPGLTCTVWAGLP